MAGQRQVFEVDGMTCGGCVRRVRGAIEALDGVTDVDVQFKDGLVTVTSDAAVDPAAVQTAVAEAGYEVAS